MIFVDTTDVAPLANLLRFVAPSVPEIPYDMSLDMLRQAYTEFARKTTLLGARITLPIQRGVQEYSLEVPAGYAVYSMKRPDDGCWCEPSPHYWYLGGSHRFRMLGNEAVRLENVPSRDDTEFSFDVRVVPDECADTIPRALSVPFGKAIAMGALADMLEMPNQPWSNPRLAQVKRLEYNRGALAGRAVEVTNHGAVAPALRHIRIL